MASWENMKIYVFTSAPRKLALDYEQRRFFFLSYFSFARQCWFSQVVQGLHVHAGDIFTLRLAVGSARGTRNNIKNIKVYQTT